MCKKTKHSWSIQSKSQASLTNPLLFSKLQKTTPHRRKVKEIKIQKPPLPSSCLLPALSMERRSKSYADNRTQAEAYNRCTSLSCAWSPNQNTLAIQDEKGPQLKRGNSLKVLADLDFQRKRRIVSYRAIGYHGKVKGSVKSSFKWIKEKCAQVAHSWR